MRRALIPPAVQHSAPRSLRNSQSLHQLRAADPWFQPAALRFLRGLARNNERPWFEARRDRYEQELRAPMLALIEAVSSRVAVFAPAYLRPAHRIMLRIYRDTRFAKGDTPPYNPRMAGWWGHPDAPRTSGPGFYFHLNPHELLIASGIFMPDPTQLRALRAQLIAAAPAGRKEARRCPKPLPRAASLQLAPVTPLAARLQTLLAPGALHPDLVPDLPADPLPPLPRGLSPLHPLAPLLRQRRWGVQARFAPEEALSPALPGRIIDLFLAATPLIHLFHELLGLSGPGPANPPD